MVSTREYVGGKFGSISGGGGSINGSALSFTKLKSFYSIFDLIVLLMIIVIIFIMMIIVSTIFKNLSLNQFNLIRL